jgi:hypothetical protein
MKLYKTEHKEYDEKVVAGIVCDVCKKSYDEDWDKNSEYDILETSVEMRTGKSYPDDTWGDIITFDICPNCFTNKLIPALLEMGAKPTKKDLGWEDE